MYQKNAEAFLHEAQMLVAEREHLQEIAKAAAQFIYLDMKLASSTLGSAFQARDEAKMHLMELCTVRPGDVSKTLIGAPIRPDEIVHVITSRARTGLKAA